MQLKVHNGGFEIVTLHLIEVIMGDQNMGGLY